MLWYATHAGITVGEDGVSHQAIEDIALMRVVPGMEVYVPSDYNSLAYYYVRNMKIYDKPLIDDKQKEKVLTKIQLKK